MHPLPDLAFGLGSGQTLGVKLLAIALVLVACRGDQPAAPDRWPEVERLATPALPGGDGALLDKALGEITGDDVPEAALEDAVAWRTAGGALPWRTGRSIDDRRPLRAMKLGTALVERRGDAATALYLAQRLRGEGAAMLDVTIGFELAKKVVDAKLAPPPDAAALAPTDAEARRALAVEGMHFVANATKDDPMMKSTLHDYYGAMVIDAPPDRAGYLARLEATTASMLKSRVGKIVAMPRMSKLVGDMFATVDAYRAWAERPGE